MMNLYIKNFKSIGELEVDLQPLTVFLGPPASGKSNLFDAVSLLGYFYRFLQLGEEYQNNSSNLEYPVPLFRASKIEHLFMDYMLQRKISLIFKNESKVDEEVKIWVEGGRVKVDVNGNVVPWDLLSLPSPQTVNTIISSISGSKEQLIVSRLYGYDRFALSNQFHNYISGVSSRNVPVNILSEFGWNITHILRGYRRVINDLNNYLKDYLDEKIDIKVSRSGVIAIYDYDFELEANSVSDSILRTIYYNIALMSGLNYCKKYGFEKKLVIMLEEPDSHVFPFMLDMLIENIKKVINEVYVLVSTHNPIFASGLLDKVDDSKVYYLRRNVIGHTEAIELDKIKMSRKFTTLEEILFMAPHEVDEYSVAHNLEEAD